MIEVLKNIFCFPVPLPKNPLKELNCYVIKGDGRNLLIDAGFNTPEGYEAVTGAFDELGLSFSDTDIFLTHLHADHTGLVERLKSSCGRIFISETDGLAVIRNSTEEYWLGRMRFHDFMGFPEHDRLDYKKHPAYKWGIMTHTDFEYVTPDMRFSYAGYNLEPIDLRGHTPGQTGLYDSEKSILFCGDHILNTITPNISLWNFETDFLGCFLENLKKVKALDIKTLFSSHRDLIKDTNKRIDGLLAHHEKRLADVLSLMAEGKSTPYEIAGGIIWDFGDGVFSTFPPAQKWFASLEVFAHLEHLRRLGKVELKENSPTYVYSIAQA